MTFAPLTWEKTFSDGWNTTYRAYVGGNMWVEIEGTSYELRKPRPGSWPVSLTKVWSVLLVDDRDESEYLEYQLPTLAEAKARVQASVG